MAPPGTTSANVADGEIQFDEDEPQRSTTRSFSQIVQQYRSVDSDANGTPYITMGAETYHDFLRRVHDVSDGVADYGLPIEADKVDIEYRDPDVRDHARWRGLQEGRQPYCILTIQDCGCRAWHRYGHNDVKLEQDITPTWHATHSYQLS